MKKSTLLGMTGVMAALSMPPSASALGIGLDLVVVNLLGVNASAVANVSVLPGLQLPAPIVAVVNATVPPILGFLGLGLIVKSGAGAIGTVANAPAAVTGAGSMVSINPASANTNSARGFGEAIVSRF